MNEKTIFENNNSIGKKAENLFKLVEIEDSNLFEVPFFRSINIGGHNIKEVISEFISRGIKEVSVRSSSDTEDTQNDSKAGAFKTLLNVNLNDIPDAINLIQKHSLDKFGHKIPIIIQEMVQNIEISGVAFSVDPDTGMNYSVFNYHGGIGEDLVSGNVSGDTVKIFNGVDEANINNALHKKLFIALKYVKQKLGNDEIDIEYSYDGNNLFLLQVRPVTKINGSKIKSSKLCERYANYISYIINKNEKVFGNMIDINPEELVGNAPIISQTFFNEIFSEGPLLDARSDMGYFRGENFMSFVLKKPYIDLEQNVKSFMPNSLTYEEVDIFVSYYKKLIKSDMTLQNQLDSVLYPNTIDKVIQILDEELIENRIKESITLKFSNFFTDLGSKFELYVREYDTIEKELLEEVGVKGFHDLLTVSTYHGSISDLLNTIKKSTYYFSIFARIFFFCSYRGDNENHDYFKSAIYQNKIFEKNKLGIKYNMPKGFDFTSFMPQEFLLDDINFYEYTDVNDINQIDISKVARENLKFIFMNMFRLLGIKMGDELGKKGLKLKQCEDIPFSILVNYIKGDIDDDELQFYISKGNTKSKIANMLDFPPVINGENSLVEHKILNEKGFFVGEGILDGKTCIINDIDEFQTKNYKDKIIIIENATPEIDIYLSKIKGIITKNGGPLAHILIRSRELGIPGIVGSSYYESLSKIDNKDISIDFDNELISMGE